MMKRDPMRREPAAHRFAASALIVLVLVAGMVSLTASPVFACTCPERSVAESVESATAVYVARPRLPDVLPGRSFRAVRVLKGASVANLRVKVQGGDEAGCGMSVPREDHVLTAGSDGEPDRLSLCTQYLTGEQAVEEAQHALGPGEPVSWRPDVAYGMQWLLLAGAVVVALMRVSRRFITRD
jgi:hypothetical protein